MERYDEVLVIANLPGKGFTGMVDFVDGKCVRVFLLGNFVSYLVEDLELLSKAKVNVGLNLWNSFKKGGGE